MDFDDFLKKMANGLDDFLGISEMPAKAPKDGNEAILAAVQEIQKLTPDEGYSEIVGRSLGVYRSVVRHVSKGGTVRFYAKDGSFKTLKIRLRKTVK